MEFSFLKWKFFFCVIYRVQSPFRNKAQPNIQMCNKSSNVGCYFNYFGDYYSNRGPTVSSMKQQYWDFQFSLYKKYILFHFQTFFWFPKMMIDSRHGFFYSLDNSEERERSASSILLGVYKRTVIFRGGAKTSRCLCLQLPFRKEEDLFGKIHHFMNMGRLGSTPPT